MSPSPPRKRGRAARTFAVGTLVGGVIAVAAPRLRRGLTPDGPASGLRAFEGAPCWDDDRDADRAARGER